MTEYKLSYTAEDIDERLGKISQLSEDIENLKNSGGSGISVQADWAQNDETAANFIKNKPFGNKLENLIEVLPETVFDQFSLDSMFGAYAQQREATYTLTVGKTYKVFWDGVEYECVAQDVNALIPGGVAVGNGSSFGFSGNGEPFIIGVFNGYEGYLALTDTSEGNSHTVRIVQAETIIDTLDPKYLPIPFFGEGQTVQTEIIAKADRVFSPQSNRYEYTAEASAELLSMWNTDWTTATVTWDGTVYTCEPQSIYGTKAIGNIDLFMGTGDNGVPFALAVADAASTGLTDMLLIISVADPVSDPDNAPDVTHNIECLINTTNITTIDQKYIKEMPWNKVTNKPFEEFPAGTVIFDTTTLNCNMNEGAEDEYIAIFNASDINKPLGNYSYEVYFDGASDIFTGNVYGDEFSIIGDNNFSFIVRYDVSGSPSMGILISTQEEHTIKITLAEDVIQTIDPKFIPKVDGLPEVTASDNGKTLTVVNGAWSVKAPASGLPSVTTSDAGKFLRVNSYGAWAVESIPNAEGVAF